MGIVDQDWDWLSENVVSGFNRLVSASRYALSIGVDARQLAVSWGELSALGLSTTDLRWMVLGKLVEHHVEVEQGSDSTRWFVPGGWVQFDESSCFVLTEEGLHFAIDTLDAHTAAQNSPIVRLDTEVRWDSTLRELKVDGELVKRFTRPAPNQEIVLAAFEEEGWPMCIDDPLPPARACHPSERLRNTVKSLNRNQIDDRLSFLATRNGTGIRWEKPGNRVAS